MLQDWHHCNHNLITGEKCMPPIPRFIHLSSATNVSYLLMLSIISLLLVNSGSGGKFVSLYTASIFAFVCYLSKISSRRFRCFYLTFGIENCKRLPFGCRIFIVGPPIKTSYEIFTKNNLWSPISDHSGRNISA